MCPDARMSGFRAVGDWGYLKARLEFLLGVKNKDPKRKSPKGTTMKPLAL